MIFFPFCNQECGGNHNRHGFGGNDGDPDTVQLPDQRKNQYRGDLKNQGTEKRNNRGSNPIVEGGKEGRAVNGKAGEKERE